MIVYNRGVFDDAFLIKIINKKLQENHRIQRLQDYYEGKHDILQRYYEDSSKPNNKIAANYMQAVTDFHVSYLIGVPIEYQNAPPIVADILRYNDDAETTQEIVLNMNIAGFGAELFYLDESGIPRFASVNPLESIFVFDNALTANLTQFIRLFPKDDRAEGYFVAVYDDVQFTEYELTAAVGELKVTKPSTLHFWGDVPAILYQNNTKMQGTFEQLIPLQNALNVVISDNVNDFESYVDAFLVLENMKSTTSEDISRMKAERVLLTDPETKAYWLTKTANTAHVEQLKTDLVDYIRELGKYPDVSDVRGLGISGEAIRMRLIPSEIDASKRERVLYKGIMRRLELLYNVLQIANKDLGTYTAIVPKFSRNFLLDTTTDKDKAATISMMLSDEIIDRAAALDLAPMIPREEKTAILERLDLADYNKANDTFDYETEDETA